MAVFRRCRRSCANPFCAAIVQSETVVKEALYESAALRRFVGAGLGLTPAPDEPTTELSDRPLDMPSRFELACQVGKVAYHFRFPELGLGFCLSLERIETDLLERIEPRLSNGQQDRGGLETRTMGSHA